MTTDYVEDQVSVTDTEIPATRWEARPLDLGTDPDEPERGGIILAAMIALLLPLLVAGAILLPDASSGESASDGNVLESIGLDDITISPTPNAEVDGSDQSDGDGAIDAEVEGATELATDAEPDPSATETETAETSPDPTSEPGADTPTPTIAPPTTGVTPTTVAPTTTTPTAAETTIAPSTTDAPTTTVSPTTSTAPTTTVSPTTSAPVTTLPPDDEPDPPAFSSRVEIGQIGETFVRYGFTAETTTTYAAVVRDDAGIVATTTGTAVGGEEEIKSANGLTPGTDYTVQVRLLGPPEAASIAVPFRTSGGSPPPADQRVEVQNLQVVSTGETRFTVNYETNICANGSFVIRELGGEVVGRNGGQADGCTTRHLAVPGFWTPPLEPGTTYMLTISVEADGQGRGEGNTSTTSIVVTTLG